MINRKLIFIALLFFLSIFFINAQESQSAVTLSVMKFDTMSDRNIDFIGESFADALTTKLTNIKDLRIYERSQFKKITNELQMNIDSAALFDEETVQNVGKIIAIDYMTLGSVTLVGDNLRVALRLIDVKTTRSILSKEVEGKYPDDVFDLQDNIALLVVKALNLKISTLERERVLKDPTNNMDAYEYYNQSLAEVSGMERIRLLRKALEKDPDFILAGHCLAESYFENGNRLSPDVDRLNVRKAYERVLKVNDGYLEAHYALGVLNALMATENADPYNANSSCIFIRMSNNSRCRG